MSNKVIDTNMGHRFSVPEDIWNEMILGNKIKIKEKNVTEDMVSDDNEKALGWMLGSLIGDGHFLVEPNTIVMEYHYHAKYACTGLVYGQSCYFKCMDQLGLHYDESAKNIYEVESVNKVKVKAKGETFRRLSPYINNEKIVTDTIKNTSLSFQSGFLSGLEGRQLFERYLVLQLYIVLYKYGVQ